jgi:hypothetical protein
MRIYDSHTVVVVHVGFRSMLLPILLLMWISSNVLAGDCTPHIQSMLYSEDSDVPDCIPQKAAAAAVDAWRWSIDRKLVRVEVDFDAVRSSILFGFYSPSKNSTIQISENHTGDFQESPLPSGWSTKPLPLDFGDLSIALVVARAMDMRGKVQSAVLQYYDKLHPAAVRLEKKNGSAPEWLIQTVTEQKYYQLPAEADPVEILQALHAVWPDQEMANAVLDEYQGKYESAFIWYEKAASHGLPGAEYSLGMMYLRGKGVAANQAEAVKWLSLASQQGFESAQKALDEIHSSAH